MSKLESMEGFSTRLRGLRKERNLRQKDLAEVLGLAQTTIANYEQNTRFPDETTLKRIVDYFNTSLDFLLGRSDQPHAPVAVAEPPSAASDNRPYLTHLARLYLETLRAGERERAVKVVMDECMNGRSIEEIYLQILQPALEEIGYQWEIAAADVYEEHFISAVTSDLMARVMQYAPTPPRRKGTFLSVASGGELHEFGLKMVNDLMELAGWQTFYLGVNVPSRAIIKAVEDHQASLLGISVTMQYNINGAATIIRGLRASRSCRNLRIIVGGRAFRKDPDLFRAIGADAQALSASEAVAVAKRLRG